MSQNTKAEQFCSAFGAQDWILTCPGYQYFINAACQISVRTFEEALKLPVQVSFIHFLPIISKIMKKNSKAKLHGTNGEYIQL